MGWHVCGGMYEMIFVGWDLWDGLYGMGFMGLYIRDGTNGTGSMQKGVWDGMHVVGCMSQEYMGRDVWDRGGVRDALRRECIRRDVSTHKQKAKIQGKIYRVCATYLIMLGWKTCKHHRETDELPNRSPT